MNEITVEGSHYDIGLKLGKILRQGGYDPPSVIPERVELITKCEKLVQKYTPTLWEELEGVVKGGNFEDTSVLQHELVLRPYPQSGCTIFAISPEFTESGKTLFARNYDWFTSFNAHFTFIRTFPIDSLSSLSCTDLTVGRYGGINEDGLAIGLTAVPGYPHDKPGVILHLATRWVLDNCSAVEDAVAFMKRIPHFRGNNYLIADKDGAIVLVEGSPEKVKVTDASDGIAYAANRYQTPEMRKLEDVRFANQTSDLRHNNIEKWYKAKRKGFDELAAQSLLSESYETGTGVCCRFVRDDAEWSTIWSWTALLGEDKMNIADGLPTSAPYKSYTF
jgi:predicted choloylglycine hydrolase